MSFYGGSGYPPQQGSYPPQQGGYPPQQGDYPPQQAAGYPPQANPYPGAAQPGYPPTGAGGLPYPANPATNLGFGAMTSEMPPGGASVPPYGSEQPSYQQPAASGYPPAGGYQQPPAAGGYPPAGGYQQQAPGGYQQPAPADGYQPPAASGYPPASGYQQSGFNPPPAAASYNQPQGAAYAQSAPSAPHDGQPPHQGGGYPGAGPAQGGGYRAPPVGGVAVLPVQGMKALSLKSAKGQGTILPTPGFNAERDAEVLRKAMKGFGTDEKAIIDVIGMRTNEERMQIKLLFKTMYGKDLIKELKGELTGRFEDVVIAMMMSTEEFEASEMKRAVDGLGTNEDTLIELFCTRNNAQITKLKETYKKLYKRNLEKDLTSETSGHFRRLMVALSAGGRQENQAPDPAKAQQDANGLHQAGEAKWGTDESKFNYILCSQSYEQLRLVFDQYAVVAGRTIEQSITREMSGDIKNGMLAIVKVVRSPATYFAEKLYKSMKGAGTADRALIRIVVLRCEVDMVQIKQEFERQYHKTLEKFILDDCSGDYKRMLISLVSAK